MLGQPNGEHECAIAYGGVFIALSLLWGWWIDKHRPDIPEIVGGAICLVGVANIMYWPKR